MRRVLIATTVLGAAAIWAPAAGAVDPPAPPIPAPPSPAACDAVAAHRLIAPLLALDPPRRRQARRQRHRGRATPRVFAVQFKQELANVETYAAFRTKIECTIRRYVLPHLAKRRPNIVAFNEDVGLMTLGTGTRGAAARGLFADPSRAPSCEPQGIPCGTLAALAAIASAYAPQISAYETRFGDVAPLAAPFVAGTDTFARGWMQTFSDMARRYGVYILGSSDQAPFRVSTDPAEIETFRDPDLPRPDYVYVATQGKAYNEAFLWAPSDVRSAGPPPLRNVVAENAKVPLTPIEQQLQLTPGPASGPQAIANVQPYRIPGTRARLAFATSLPAFTYGSELGSAPPVLDPCSDVAAYYMPCLDRLGANLVIQDEANPGRWAALGGQGAWQPLEWMGSTWRAAADPAVHFAYDVTPMMVGNLADLPFDGQTAIAQRGLRGKRRCSYVGNLAFQPGSEADPPQFAPYAGSKREFLAIAPWVRPNGPRSELRQTSAALAPGSGSPLENDYLETALIADLPVPVRRKRANCVSARASRKPEKQQH